MTLQLWIRLNYFSDFDQVIRLKPMNSNYDRLESEPRKKENPRKSASVFSILFFCGVREILAICQKCPLENNDLFPLLEEDKTQILTEKLHQIWKEDAIPLQTKQDRNIDC